MLILSQVLAVAIFIGSMMDMVEAGIVRKKRGQWKEGKWTQ